MNRTEAKEFVLQQEPIFLKAAKKIGGKPSYVCPNPNCGNGSGKDGTGITKDTSAGTNKMHPHYKCFKCGGYYDIVELYALEMGKSTEDAETYNSLYSYYGLNIDTQSAPDGHQSSFKGKAYKEGLDPDKTQQTATESATEDYTEYYKECRDRLQNSPEAITYLKARGISAETAAKYWLGFDPKADPAKSNHPTARVIIPASKGHYIGRSIDDEHTEKMYRKLNVKGGTPYIFNYKALNSGADAVFITEGWADALAIIEAGGTAAALNSTSNYELLVSMLEEQRTDAKIIIALDNDEEGIATSKKLAAELERIGIEHITAELCGAYKDPSEAHINEPEAFKERVKAAEQKAQLAYIAEFLETVQTEAYKPYTTGLTFFDNLLDGGIIRQTLTLLLAAPATGKTTLCLQIAEKMATAKKPVIYLNFEMSKEQMLAKNISERLARDNNIFLSALQILQGYGWSDRQKELITAELKRYGAEVYPYLKMNPEGITGDLDKLIEYLRTIGERAVKEGREAPAVFVDYLHLITNSKGLDAQELVKQALLALKQYAVDYNTFVVGIVACNRDSNKSGKISLYSGRDSSALEYTADYQISLDYLAVDEGTVKPENEADMEMLKKAPEREMILRVLKNRFGISGNKAVVKYNSKCNLFMAEGAANMPVNQFIDSPEGTQENIFTQKPKRF